MTGLVRACGRLEVEGRDRTSFGREAVRVSVELVPRVVTQKKTVGLEEAVQQHSPNREDSWFQCMSASAPVLRVYKRHVSYMRQRVKWLSWWNFACGTQKMKRILTSIGVTIEAGIRVCERRVVVAGGGGALVISKNVSAMVWWESCCKDGGKEGQG
jgi:hypothetical protein